VVVVKESIFVDLTHLTPYSQRLLIYDLIHRN